MFAKTYEKLIPYAQWKYIIIGLVLTTFINLVAFPYAGNKILKTAPQATGPIDLNFSYSVDEVYQMVESYGTEGRKIYAKSTIGIDVLYPIIYTFIFVIIIIMLYRKIYPSGNLGHVLVGIPIVTFFADLLENTGIVIMLNKFPEQLNSIASITSICSSVKWTFVGLTILTILILLLVLVLKPKVIK